MSQRMYIVSQQLIANNIDLISATSWNGYQKQGRGIVLIDGGTAADLETAASPLVYVTEEKAQASDNGWPSEDVAGLVKKYVPDSEVIVVVKWRGQVGVYRFKPPVAPPNAYEGLKHMMP